MTNNVRSRYLTRWLLTTLLALVTAVFLALITRFIPSINPHTKWAVVFLIVAAAMLACARIHTAGTCRIQRVFDALEKLRPAVKQPGSEEPVGYPRDPEERLDSLIRDISETVRTLEHDRKRAEILLSNMGDGIIAVDQDGIITLFNRAASAITHGSGKSVLGARIEDADLHPEIARLAYDCIESKQILESEISLPGLPQRVVGLRAAPCPALSHGDDCAMIILRDLSEVRRHEKNQREFVSNVSHELRTPITSVRVTAEALLSGAKNDDQLVDRFLRTIVSESDRLSALIEDLMEIARRDSGIVKITQSEVNIFQVIERAVAVVRPQAEEKHVVIKMAVDEGLTGRCDEIQVAQLVRNLVDNAVKYTPEQGTVEVGAHKDQRNLMIYVKDTGIGIPHGEVDRIFERFYRVDKARSRRLGGTGLGLAIVKEIVEAHGGMVDVETRLGKGSTFTVTLPQV